MSRRAAGRVVREEMERWLVVERRFRAPIDDVWASVTESERLERWIGTWAGKPAVGGTVAFTMTAEGVEEPEDVTIVACEPPRLLVLDMPAPGGVWRVELHLDEDQGVTTLQLRQPVTSTDEVGNVGPGWEYYLDRLAASRERAQLPEWEEYYPAQQAHYERAAAAV